MDNLPFEHTQTIFNAVKKGNLALKEDLFESIWQHSTTYAHHLESRPLLHQIYQWSEQNQQADREYFCLSNLTLGFVEFLADQFETGLEYLNKARQLYRDMNDSEGEAACDISIGFLYRSTGDIDLALKYGLNSLEVLMGKKRFKIIQFSGCYWLGGLYAETDHLEEAIQMFKKGLSIRYHKEGRSLDARLTNGLAGVYLKQKKYKLALKYFNKAIELSEFSTEKTFKARGLTDLGDYYCAVGDYPQAVHFNEEALKFRTEWNIQNGSITNLINLGRLHGKMRNHKTAVTYLQKALELADQIGVKIKQFQIHHMLSEIYSESGNYKRALQHHKLYHEIRNLVNREDMEQKVKNQIELIKAEHTRKENAIILAQKKEIEDAKRRSDELLKNILPEEIAEELKNKGSAEARMYPEVTVLFTDFKDFTRISEQMTATEMVEEIHKCFKAFDEIIERYEIEKIKTIGDSYMCAGGLPVPNKTHALDVVNAAIDIRDFMSEFNAGRIRRGVEPLQIRIGINTGPVVAGIVGIRKFAYDIWGDTVNTASRMESSGEAGKVNVSAQTYPFIKDRFECTYRGKIKAKSKGDLDMYFVERKG